MWVLVPLPRSNSQSAEQQSSSSIYLTACGNITVGRPLKKGSTVGKADILIFNEQSVSSIHAKLQVEAPAVQGFTLTHGTISITGKCLSRCTNNRKQHVAELYHEPAGSVCCLIACGMRRVDAGQTHVCACVTRRHQQVRNPPGPLWCDIVT